MLPEAMPELPDGDTCGDTVPCSPAMGAHPLLLGSACREQPTRLVTGNLESAAKTEVLGWWPPSPAPLTWAGQPAASHLLAVTA